MFALDDDPFNRYNHGGGIRFGRDNSGGVRADGGQIQGVATGDDSVLVLCQRVVDYLYNRCRVVNLDNALDGPGNGPPANQKGNNGGEDRRED